MEDRLEREIAASLDLAPELLAHAAGLLEGAGALGSSPETLISVLRPHAHELAGRQAVDLGCGLGATSIAIAREIGCRVLGVDAFEPFLEQARAAAARAGVADRCAFRRDDVRHMLQAEGRFDLAVWAAMGPLLGDLRETVRQVRRVVHAGGLVAIEDFVRPAADGVPDLDGARAAIASAGDEVLREVAVPAWQLREAEKALRSHVRARAQELASADPLTAATLLLHIERLDASPTRGEQGVHTCVWLLRRR